MTVTWSLALILSFLAGCGGEEQPPEPAKPIDAVQEPAEVKPEEKRPAPEAGFTVQGETPEWLKASSLGEHAAAVEALVARVVAGEGDAVTLAALLYEARAAGRARQAADALAGATAKAGAEADFHEVAGLLAAAAGGSARPAVEALLGIDRERGAALAVMCGVAAPAGDATDGPALLLAAAGGKGDAAALGVATFNHWRARLAQAQVLRGPEAAKADVLLAELASEGPAQARYEVSMMLAEGSAPSPDRAGHALSAASAAVEAGLPGQAADAVAVAARLHVASASRAEVLASFDAVRDALAGRGFGAAAARVAVSTAWLAATVGEVQRAWDLATATAEWLEGAGLPTADAAWAQADAAWRLRRADFMATAATRAGDRRPWVESARRVLVGDARSAVEGLPRPSADHGLWLCDATLEGALATNRDVGPATRCLREAADELGHLPTRVGVLLRLVEVDGASASAARDELGRMAEGLGAAGAPLSAELAARAWLDGRSPTPPTAAFGTQTAAWTAILTGALPEPVEGEHPLIPWARGRSLVAAGRRGEGIDAWVAAVRALPRLPLTTTTVLYGDAGPRSVTSDLALLAGTDSASALGALAIHDWWNGRLSLEMGLAAGDSPQHALALDERVAFNAARARLDAATLRWLAGLGDEPLAEREAMQQALAKALATPAFSRALPAPSPDWAAVIAALGHTAVFSYRLDPAGGGEAVVVTASAGRVVPLEDTAELQAQVRQFVAQVSGGGPTSPQIGDKLRRQLVDVFQEEITGLGQYLFVPGALWGLPFGALPEQQDGLRHLADIRHIAYTTSLGDLWLEPAEVRPLKYANDFLGLAPFPPDQPDATAATRVPTEVETAMPLYGGGRRVGKVGVEATEAAFLEKAAESRVIHLSDFRVGDGGSIQLADGELTLAEIRGQQLTARLVVLSGDVAGPVAWRQAQAFKAAGAETVVVGSYLLPMTARNKFVATLHEAAVQDTSILAASFDGRRSIITGGYELGEKRTDPSWWSPYMVMMRP